MKNLVSQVVALLVFLWLIRTQAEAATADSLSALTPHGRAKHVVVVVWDGMRPDLISRKFTPHLFQLSQGGVFFAHHHAVYVSSTEVNGTAMATGMYPEHSGIIGNKEYRPQIDPKGPVGMETGEAIRRGDLLPGGYLQAPTLAEMLQNLGCRTVIAGTKLVAHLHDRIPHLGLSSGSAVLFAGNSSPDSLSGEIRGVLGPFPSEITFPNAAQDNWTTQALVEQLWKKEVPPFSLLWLSDPDFSQHHTAPGAPTALEALKSDDDNLGRVLEALSQKGLRAQTDVFVISDHGFSTVEQSVDLEALLKAAGFRATRRFIVPPADGDILIVGNGGSVFFYVVGHRPDVIGKLTDFLQKSEISGVIFTKMGIPGTFTLEQGKIDSPAAPDVVVSLRWSDHVNDFAIAGSIVGDVIGGQGKGMHSTLSRFDMHNTLIANGPDLLVGYVDSLPSGNIDLAPTIAWLLGVSPLQSFDGRVLTEALLPRLEPRPVSTTERLEAHHSQGGGTWRQYLQLSRVGKTIYFDEGNGEFH